MSKAISFHYTLTNTKGETLDSSAGQEPLAFLEGQGQIIPGLEKSILSLKVGDKKKVTLVADEAYGPRQKERIYEVPVGQFPKKDIKVGDQFEAGGDQNPGFPFTVVAVTATHVSLDGNHPLAGEDLTFDVELVSIREATAEELSHGHIHGEGGHHH